MSEETSEEIGAIAARLMQHDDPEVRRVAASCLTQRPSRDGIGSREEVFEIYRARYGELSGLDEAPEDIWLDLILATGIALGAHAPRSAAAVAYVAMKVFPDHTFPHLP